MKRDSDVRGRRSGGDRQKPVWWMGFWTHRTRTTKDTHVQSPTPSDKKNQHTKTITWNNDVADKHNDPDLNDTNEETNSYQ